MKKRLKSSDKNHLNTAFHLAVLCATVILSTGCSPKSPGVSGNTKSVGKSSTTPIGDTLRLTIVPYEAANKLTEEYTPMAKYLARKMGRKEGVFFPVSDYAGVLPALQAGQVDVAYLSPLPYAIGSSQMKLHPLAMPYVRGTLTYNGIIFVRADSSIKTLADLKGRTFAFGDPGSSSGYLLPRGLLEKNGIPLASL
jgi:phosphonate transport system substrate-binding protein